MQLQVVCQILQYFVQCALIQYEMFSVLSQQNLLFGTIKCNLATYKFNCRFMLFIIHVLTNCSPMTDSVYTNNNWMKLICSINFSRIIKMEMLALKQLNNPWYCILLKCFTKFRNTSQHYHPSCHYYYYFTYQRTFCCQFFLQMSHYFSCFGNLQCFLRWGE